MKKTLKILKIKKYIIYSAINKVNFFGGGGLKIFIIQKVFHDLCMHYQGLYKNGGWNLNIAYKKSTSNKIESVHNKVFFLLNTCEVEPSPCHVLRGLTVRPFGKGPHPGYKGREARGLGFVK